MADLLLKMLLRLDSAAPTDFRNICESNFRDISFTDKQFMEWFLTLHVDFTFTDRDIPHETLKCLLPDKMVTDDVVYFLLRFAIQRAPHKDRVVYVDSQILNKFERHGISALRDGKRQPWWGCKIVVCPIHQGVHWYMVLLFPESRICWILDSLHNRTNSRCYLRCQYTDAKELMVQFFRDDAEIQLPEYTAPLSFVLALARNHLGEAFGELPKWKFWLLPDTLHPQQESTSNDCALATFRAAYGVLTSKTLVPPWTPQSCAGEDYTQLRRLAFHLILQDTLRKQGDAALMQLIRTYVPGTGEAGDPMVIG